MFVSSDKNMSVMQFMYVASVCVGPSCSRLVLEQGWLLWSSCDYPGCGDTAVSIVGCDGLRFVF